MTFSKLILMVGPLLYSVQPADLYCTVLHCTDLYSLLTVTSSVKPIPPQNWRQESVICLASQGVKDISRFFSYYIVQLYILRKGAYWHILL